MDITVSCGGVSSVETVLAGSLMIIFIRFSTLKKIEMLRVSKEEVLYGLDLGDGKTFVMNLAESIRIRGGKGTSGVEKKELTGLYSCANSLRGHQGL